MAFFCKEFWQRLVQVRRSRRSTLVSMGLLTAVFTTLFAANVFAHSGHDETPVKPLLSIEANQSMARASAHSEQFELVLVWREKAVHAEDERSTTEDNPKHQTGELQIYLDDYASNLPVTGAQIEVSGDNFSGTAKEQSAGVYLLPYELGERAALTFVIQVGEQVDLLVTDLIRPTPAEASKHNHGYLDDFPAYWPGWLTAVIAASLLVLVLLWRRQQIATWLKGAQQ
ncbi:MAG: hypothetical protein J0M22_07965 [Gammaproteobacteria bacterium]|nr:hypothetical protein [Gammaproteobacteria bacterium]